jgi:hypothetical protein
MSKKYFINLHEKDQLGDPGDVVKIPLELVLKKYTLKLCIGLNWLRIGPSDGLLWNR